MSTATMIKTPKIDWTRDRNGDPAPKLRRKRMRAVLAQIVLYPENHHQKAWITNHGGATPVKIPGNGTICGTAACVAGWALLMDPKKYQVGEAWGDKAIFEVDTNETVDSYAASGREALGLTYDESERLFHESNDLKTIIVIMRDIEAGKYRYKVSA